MAKVELIAASELVEDFDLYPRPDVDSTHVNNMTESLHAGEELPPIIACGKSKRIVDGFHRRRAWLRFGGATVKVPVVFRDYRNDGELFLEATTLNSGHGRRLTAYDHVRCATIASRLKLKPAQIAVALRLTVDKVETLLTTRTATGPLRGRLAADDPDGNIVPIKRTIQHMAGKRLTKEQESGNDRLSGMQPMFYVNQLITLLECDLMPKDDEKLDAGLERLESLLKQRMVGA